jgi:hypothetical protein
MPSEHESLQELLEQKRADVRDLQERVAAATPPAIRASSCRYIRNICAVFSCGSAFSPVFVAAMSILGVKPHTDATNAYIIATVSAVASVILAYWAKYYHDRARSYNMLAKSQ